jgi:hypothetical protein
MLRGNAVKVNDALFRVDLSNVAADRQYNLDLLSERNWFDIAMFYGNKRRAILAVDKGGAGAPSVQRSSCGLGTKSADAAGKPAQVALRAGPGYAALSSALRLPRSERLP